MNPSSEIGVVLLTKVPSEVQAAAIKQALADEGIRSESNGEAIAGYRAEAPAMVRVLVFAADLEPAREVLEKIAAEAPEIDWDRVDVGQPEG